MKWTRHKGDPDRGDSDRCGVAALANSHTVLWEPRFMGGNNARIRMPGRGLEQCFENSAGPAIDLTLAIRFYWMIAGKWIRVEQKQCFVPRQRQ